MSRGLERDTDSPSDFTLQPLIGKSGAALCDISQASLSSRIAHYWDWLGLVQSFYLVLRGAISFQSKAHKLPQSTRQVLINIQTFAFKSSPIYSSFPSICETWQGHSGLLFVGGPRREEYYGGYYTKPTVESDEVTRSATWGQDGAAACSKESILNLCWWPGSSLLTLSPASWSAALSQYQIFGDIRASPLHHNGPGTPPVQLQTSPIRPRCLRQCMVAGGP